MNAPPQLAALQQWLLATIAEPTSIDATTVCNRLTASQQQTAAERLSVYQRAYFARLLDVLADLFPCTRFAVADETFAELAAGYVVRHPPNSYTLARLADRFTEYLDQTRPKDGDWGRFVVELAQLEQAIDRIFDGPGPEHLPPFSLPAAADASLTLQLAPGFELHAFQYPASTFYSDWKAGREPAWPEPQPQHVALLRRDYIVRRFELSEAQFSLLAAIQAGEPLGAALAAAAEQFEDGELATAIREWFTTWAAAGFFVGYKPDA